MSRKIIGVTVGTTLPKPNFKQTDPTKGDYIKNKPDFDGLKDRVDTVSGLVGDIPVSEQISNALSDYSSGTEIYSQNDEPVDAPDGSLWVDLDAVTEHTADEALTLLSPSGKKFKITIDDDGVLTATEIVESAT